jgi:hypothetical protein
VATQTTASYICAVPGAATTAPSRSRANVAGSALHVPDAAWRDKVVPRIFPETPTHRSAVPDHRRPSWAMLLRKTFAVDALACPRCAGRMRPVAVLSRPDDIKAALQSAVARPPP